mgnify:CR=1 FL=1|jgi:hypothetical protein
MASRQFAGVLILARLCATQLQARVNPVGDVIEALGGQCYCFCGDFGADLTPLTLVAKFNSLKTKHPCPQG